MRTTTEQVSPLRLALSAAYEALSLAGDGRIELVTVTRGRLCLQPTVLADGEAIARSLGCDVPLDHRMLVPGHTLWTGVRDGLEVQVRSVLRRPLGAER
ncbi:hypothetical protein [Antribacter gilvus]|uniref:hypothetical protein n=1 Tax=Antribacter gilvus TaxID=2304675 RepID=UPI000F777268|nr:hypothetical protein [Antribacter gilvus]